MRQYGTQWPPTVLGLPPPHLAPPPVMGSMTNSSDTPPPVAGVSPPAPLRHGGALGRPCTPSWNPSLLQLRGGTLPILCPEDCTYKNGSPCLAAHLIKPSPGPFSTVFTFLPPPLPLPLIPPLFFLHPRLTVPWHQPQDHLVTVSSLFPQARAHTHKHHSCSTHRPVNLTCKNRHACTLSRVTHLCNEC